MRNNRIMEILWLIIAGVTLVLSVYAIMNEGFSENWYFIFFPFLAGAMYALRRFARKKEEGK